MPGPPIIVRDGAMTRWASYSRRSGAACLAALALGAVALNAEVVYENISRTNTQPEFFPSIVEYGDEIRLGGIGRQIVQFRIEYFADVAPTNNASARVRIYANDGPGRFPEPGTRLYESDPFPLTPGYSAISLDGLDLAVPDVITWSIEFSGISGALGSQAGLLLADPTSAGFSYYDFWVRTATGWALFHFEPDPKANFIARVSAKDVLTAKMGGTQRLADGRLRMQLTGLIGRTCVIQASTNFTDWRAIGLFDFKQNHEEFIDPDAARYSRRFYRALTTLGGPMRLSGPVKTGNGASELQISGPGGLPFIFEVSRDFNQWTPAFTNTFGSRPIVYTNSFDAPAMFYRTRLIP
jgi:hypothetical protein